MGHEQKFTQNSRSDWIFIAVSVNAVRRMCAQQWQPTQDEQNIYAKQTEMREEITLALIKSVSWIIIIIISVNSVLFLLAHSQSLESTHVSNLFTHFSLIEVAALSGFSSIFSKYSSVFSLNATIIKLITADDEKLLSHNANTETVMNQKRDSQHQNIYMINFFHGHCALLCISYVWRAPCCAFQCIRTECHMVFCWYAHRLTAELCYPALWLNCWIAHHTRYPQIPFAEHFENGTLIGEDSQKDKPFSVW